MKEWEDNPPWMQAMLIAYDQIRQYEESQMAALMGGMKFK